MDGSAERFLEESKGLATEPPWGMTTGEAAAFQAGGTSSAETIAHLRQALGEAIRGAEKAMAAFDRERARAQELQQLLDDTRDVKAELRQRIYDLEQEVEAYE